MTQPDPGHADGLGKAPEGAPDMFAPPPAVVSPQAGSPLNTPNPSPALQPLGPPPSDLPPLADRPPSPSRRPWALIGALGAAIVIGLVVAIVAITGDEEPPPTSSTIREAECDPPEKTTEKPIPAQDFYLGDPWRSGHGGETSPAERLGVWDHVDCCDIGVVTSMEEISDAGCEWGIEAAYRTEDGSMGIAQLILAYPSTSAARAGSEIDFPKYRFAPESGFYETDVDIYGISESVGRYVIVTVGSIEPRGDEALELAQRTLSAFHGEHAFALVW